MPDIVSLVGSALATVSAGIEAAKNFKEVNIELNLVLLKKQLSLAENEATRIRNENSRLYDENRRLRKLLKEKADPPLVFDKKSGFYRDKENSLYCPACYEGKHKRSHLQYKTINFFEPWHCPLCKHDYSGSAPDLSSPD